VSTLVRSLGSPCFLQVVSKPGAPLKRIVGGMNTTSHRKQGGQTAIRAGRDGARAMAPWLVGIAPLGFVIGVTTARAASDGRPCRRVAAHTSELLRIRIQRQHKEN
jgi:hypothetical protein